MRKGLVAFQIGKNGVTAGFIETLKLAFKNRKLLKIQILPSAAEHRVKIMETADRIANELGGNYKYRIIGFTIVLRRIGMRKRKN